MRLLGIALILGGGQFVINAFRRRKITSRDLWGKADDNKPLTVRESIAYSLLGLGLIALGLNYVIR